MGAIPSHMPGCRQKCCAAHAPTRYAVGITALPPAVSRLYCDTTQWLSRASVTIHPFVSRPNLPTARPSRARRSSLGAGRPCRRLYSSPAECVAPPVACLSTHRSTVSWHGAPSCHDTKHCIVTQHQMGSSPFLVSAPLFFFFNIFFFSFQLLENHPKIYIYIFFIFQ